MNDDIQVTVYCLAYNHEKYIRSALEGFVMQKTNFAYEVIVHDDASTDGTAAIIREYAEKYPEIIKPIYQTENQYSKKTPIFKTFISPIARGKYIATCEGDDYWCCENKLQMQYDALESHPECSASVHKVQCHNEDDTPNDEIIPGSRYKLNETQILDDDMIAKCFWIRGPYPFQTSSYFLRKEVFDVPLKMNRDIGTLHKAITLGHFYYFDDIMSVRRLFTIGCFNSRLKSKGDAAHYELAKGNLNNYINFDEYTNYRYHKYLQCAMFADIFSCCKYDYADRKYVKELNISVFSALKQLDISLKKKMYYAVYWTGIKLCPRTFKFLLKYMKKLRGLLCKGRIIENK